MKVNRIMEAYIWYIQEKYLDAGRTVDESYRGEFQVEEVIGRRVLELRATDEEDEEESNEPSRTFPTHFPLPLTAIVKSGDILNLQISHLEQNGVWIPCMYSGFTPIRDDNGGTTPRGRGASADPAALQAALARLQLAGGRAGNISQTPRRRQQSSIRIEPSLADFTFDEAKFTEAYFRSWEGDIDADEGSEPTSPSDEGAERVTGTNDPS